MVRARPAAASEETLVELVSIDSPELDDADVQLTIKAMSLPSSILTDPNKSTLEEPFVNVVAEVTSVGADVTDLAAGMTVYGYIPADFASHVTLPRKLLHVVSIPKETDPLIALDVLQEDMRSRSQDWRMAIPLSHMSEIQWPRRLRRGLRPKA